MLSGTGTSNQDFDSSNLSAAGGVGYFVNDWLELGVRQDIGYLETGGQGPSSVWFGGTKASARANFQVGRRFVPYGGVNFGGAYGGRGVADTLAAGLEGGLKWYVQRDAYVGLGAEYQWFFNDLDQAGSTFDDGRFVYGLGIGLDF
jgi:hypothetical protein